MFETASIDLLLSLCFKAAVWPLLLIKNLISFWLHWNVHVLFDYLISIIMDLILCNLIFDTLWVHLLVILIFVFLFMIFVQLVVTDHTTICSKSTNKVTYFSHIIERRLHWWFFVCYWLIWLNYNRVVCIFVNVLDAHLLLKVQSLVKNCCNIVLKSTIIQFIIWIIDILLVFHYDTFICSNLVAYRIDMMCNNLLVYRLWVNLWVITLIFVILLA